jgi:hypothetical protein
MHVRAGNVLCHRMEILTTRLDLSRQAGIYSYLALVLLAREAKMAGGTCVRSASVQPCRCYIGVDRE